jgi:glycosyltransferase involved in cell wall biosynthesis
VPAERISILPGLTPPISAQTEHREPHYFTFVGRVSREKGIDDIIYAAKKLPHVRFAIAGKVNEEFQQALQLPNISLKGFLNNEELDTLYQQSKAILVPSQWYEGFPNVITRAFYHKRPVITTNMGCFTDIIEHGENGFMYTLGKPDEFVRAIEQLNQNTELVQNMGAKGYEKAVHEYSRDKIYEGLMVIYDKALKNTHAL